jgi:ubiquinone/menaquinone biosynthesis C-methylase UbiE
MLAAAHTDPALPGIGWIRGCLEALPIRDDSADLVFLFLVYHHLADRPTALQECRRVLAKDAPLLIVNSTLESLDSYLWLPFFPSARAIDRARLPSRAGLVEAAQGAQLRLRWHRTVENPVASSLSTYADRIASRTISTLQLVPDHEFARGIFEFRRFCEREDRGQPVRDQIDAFLFVRVG